ncbi:2-oxoacid:acceptor oxidoreductase family protein [Dehalobacter sp. DCM]|uniref:2-oxoacid:acceptor oxidoreductase family protein n=1 Tax=Dehalobacter sp. DCM TaxID=2907827 RepID=UPI00308141D7|nr:2-oxoacid:acceptor oxidoreductase family protein [Dehalobacter sp. DCM]
MSKTMELNIAGFGGQGVLFAGKILVYAGMLAGKEVSWLPSYGPEMRGGTANINVIVSDTPIGSPIINYPNMLVAMNQPSLEKFESDVQKEGMIIVDSALIPIPVTRTDVTVFYIPATKLAEEAGLKGLANMVMVGKIAKETGIFDLETLNKAVSKSIPERKKELLASNIQAIEIGYNYI